jgi:hypothetical protein
MTDQLRIGIYDNSPELLDFFQRKANQAGIVDFRQRSVAGLDALLARAPTEDDRIDRAWRKLQSLPFEMKEFLSFGTIPTDLFD